ncbi:adenosine deaminase/editase [Annulohypoxylon maeteangense]|uniref:adenosine deaminase/editase n=1 Tax=Annulohypoxylon maeteangense TaxID=1927788 RepID=UPI002008563E|nr:adenosine deaminase/editase [Annulohypoxylon maeteangense]KAI0883831.1 adenosine deaminase/editase [Annulohypoxylon maeteangense]
MTISPDVIAELVQKHYDALPAKRKPTIRGNGLREWVPLAGIVAQDKNDELWCLSIATGMKCLPSSKVAQAQGNLLHDWHAEVLVIRAFNRFVLDECKILAQGGSSKFLRRRTIGEIKNSQIGKIEKDISWHGQSFTWKEDIFLHMYCSEAPCGDASMELIMASQEDATPWDLPPEFLPNNTTASPTLPGRAYFSHLGITRRKPARPDAPPTLSKSCSDKLALHQLTSLLSSTTALLVSPNHVYIHTLILPLSRYSAVACHRAFSVSPGGRMSCLAHLTSNTKGGYAFHPFAVATTTSEFAFSQKQAKEEAGAAGIAPSNLALAWTLSGLEEATLGGVLQGRKQSAADARGASFASRRKLWGLAVEIVGLLSTSPLPPLLQDIRPEEGEGEIEVEIGKALGAKTYGEMKGSSLLEARRRVKEEARVEALKGWVRNLGDEYFHL